eukprot:1177984-Prorocentrum_minimum.AAC.6
MDQSDAEMMGAGDVLRDRAGGRGGQAPLPEEEQLEAERAASCARQGRRQEEGQAQAVVTVDLNKKTHPRAETRRRPSASGSDR